ncbi:MAG TPA: hypothetical protein VMS21_05195 [Methylomirabilota bacterium]|nr:hypothetical protein [Methylomirabilota bacterium]
MIPSTKTLIGFSALGGVALACLLMAAPGGNDNQSSSSSNSAPVPEEAAEQFPVTIRRPEGPPQVATGLTNRHGEAITVSCSSCHTTTTPNRDIHSGEQLEKFHQGLHYAHGSLSCLSCHNENNYDTLRLANGNAVEYADVMTLCGQCHGPQLRDYRRGLHGGMTGFWDLSRGPRTRNNCIHCHDPHAPKFPLVQPVFPPRDRLPVPRNPDPTAH